MCCRKEQTSEMTEDEMPLRDSAVLKGRYKFCNSVVYKYCLLQPLNRYKKNEAQVQSHDMFLCYAVSFIS